MSKTSTHGKKATTYAFHTNFIRATLHYKPVRSLGLLLLFLLIGLSNSYAQPTNDFCSGAVEIPVAPGYYWFSNQLATNSGALPAPGCGQYQGADVWFKLTVPVGENLRIDVASNENPKYALAVYTGTCNSLTLFDCDDVGAGGLINGLVNISAGEGLGGEVIYVRVFRYGSTAGNWFKFQAKINTEVAENDAYADAVVLTNTKGTFEFQTFSTEFATASVGVITPPCGIYYGDDVWFKTEVPMSGKLVVETNPGTITPNVAVYTGTEGALTNIACSTAGLNDAGGEVIIEDVNLAGEEISIRVFSNQAGGGTFDIVVLEPRQDVCADAIELTDISEIESYVPYTNQYAKTNADGTEPTCGLFTGKDIWFTAQVPSSGKMTIDTKKEDTSPVMPVLTVYTGPDCNNLTQYACNFFGSANPFGAIIEIDDAALKDQYIFIRMYGYNNATGGAFEMAVTQPVSLPVELISFRGDVLNNEAVLLKWETATEINNDYFIVEHSVDGHVFTPVGHVSGEGTTSDIQFYGFEHTEPYFGENYYRLKQVDFDGAFEYSRIVTAIIKMEEAKINVFPNPVMAEQGINIRWIGDFGKEKTQLIITNTAGRQVFWKELDVRNERQSFVDLSRLGLDAGIYYLTVNDKNSLITHQKINLVRD